MKTRKLLAILLGVAGLFYATAAAPAFAADAATPETPEMIVPDGYTVTRSQMPMRDGVELETLIIAPKNQDTTYPFLMERTPYGDWSDSKALEKRFQSGWKELSEEGYIFVLQHIRGRYNSGGDYVMYRGGRDRSDPKAVDDSTDTYDTVEWLIRNVPNNNGKAGIMGTSNPGSLAAMALIDSHPALKAASPQAAAIFQFTGDDFIHNGAFSLSPNYAYSQWRMWTKQNGAPAGSGKESPKKDLVGYNYADHYEFFLRLGPLRNVNDKFFKGQFPLWDELIAHPNFDEYWKSRAFDHLTKHTDVATLAVGGIYDPQDQKGPFGIFDTLNGSDKAGVVQMAVGPWRHGDWNASMEGGGRRLGDLDFGTATADVFRETVQAPFFAYHLKGKGSAFQGDAIMFQTGTNRWVRHEQYPPKTATLRKLYFHTGHSLSFDAPSAEKKAFEQYTYDPAYPVPHAPRPIPDYYSEQGQLWRTMDQRFAHLRPDVIFFETDELKEDLTISGEVVANLFASTSGTDADWVVKLIDVYPSDMPDQPKLAGYQYLVTGEIFRAKYRNSLAKPEPVKPGAILPYRFSLLSRDHVFKKGHRVLVQVQSSWFPMFDRNPGKFMEISTARDEDYQATTQRIYHSEKYPSAIEVYVDAGK